MTIRIHFLFTLLLFFTAACKHDTDYVVTIKTKFGDMVAILYDETPKHKENFLKLAREHYYDSLLFHRIIDGFMIQTGDPDSKKAGPGQRLGTGGPGYTIPAEFANQYFHEKGALSAARLPDQQNPSKASSGSQFFIVDGSTFTEADLKTDQMKLNLAMQQFFQNPANRSTYDSLLRFYEAQDFDGYQSFIKKLRPRVEKEAGVDLTKEVSPDKLKVYTSTGGAPHLDGEYTVFGKVIRGLDVIDKIASQPKDANDRPLENIRIHVTVEEMPKKQIEEKYGYNFPAKD